LPKPSDKVPVATVEIALLQPQPPEQVIELIAENLPLEHCLQSEIIFSEKNPALHEQSLLFLLPADETEFSGHLLHLASLP